MRFKLISLITLLFAQFLLKAQEVILPNIEGRTLIANGSNGGPSSVTNDNLGVSVANIGDLNNDGVEDMVIGAYNDDDGAGVNTNYGAIYVCFMTTSKTVSSYVKIGHATSGIGSDISSNDLFGRTVAGIGDLNNDGYEDIVVGAHGSDITSYTNSGAIYVIFLNNTAGIVSYKKITRGGNGGPTTIKAASNFGISVTNIGDINGDRKTDIAVGGHNHDGPSSGASNGAVWTLCMNTNGTVASSEIITKSTGWSGTLDNSDFFGISVAGAGDLNGDDIPDVLVSATGDDDYNLNDGALYLLFLNSSGTADTFYKYTQPLINGVIHYTVDLGFANSVLVNDINDDGQPEFIIGSAIEGSIFILATDTAENVIAVKKIDNYIHTSYDFTGAGLGHGITSMNDLDGDGKKELVFGALLYDANSHTDNGGVYIIDMTTTDLEFKIGDVLEIDKYSELSNSIATLASSDQFGSAVCQIGDVDGDGYNDIAVGAQGDNDGGANRGAVYVVFLDSLQRKKAVQKISSSSGGFGSGLDDGDTFGNSVCGAGDLDADGIPDLFVGAIHDDDGGTDRGCVWIIYLDSNGTVKSKSKIASGTGGFSGTLSNSCFFGISVAAPGDINHDGVNDVVIGAHQDDDGGTDKGAVWVCFLNSSETVIGQQKISDTQGSFTASFSGNSVHFGISVDGAGDLNYDGNQDIVVGSHLMDGGGAVYILYLDTLGHVLTYSKIGNQNGNFPYTLESTKQFGVSVKMIDDMDGDGNREIAIGQNFHSSLGNNKGAIWICFPDSLGNITDARLISEDTSTFYGTLEIDDRFGKSIAGYRDSDSVEHIFVGALLGQENHTDEGAVFRVKLAKPADILNKVTSFAQLFREPDGGYYKVSDDHKLYFEYRSEYTASELRYNIYDQDHEIVKSNTSTPGLLYSYEQTAYSDDKVWEQNKFFLKLPTLSNGHYLLEIIDEKNDRQYLRFWMPK